MQRKMIFVFATMALSACASEIRQEQIQTALALTPEHFSETATLKDDSLDTVATISTVNGFQEKRGLLGIVWDDNFLRAFIDKKSGKTSFQVYQILYYSGSGWNFYEAVNYETPSGPQSTKLTVINRDVDCSGSRYMGCTYVEHVAFDVDESLLRLMASRYSPGQPVGWKFKYLARSGKEYPDAILPAEVAGLLQSVDAYRASHGLVHATGS